MPVNALLMDRLLLSGGGVHWTRGLCKGPGSMGVYVLDLHFLFLCVDTPWGSYSADLNRSFCARPRAEIDFFQGLGRCMVDIWTWGGRAQVAL